MIGRRPATILDWAENSLSMRNTEQQPLDGDASRNGAERISGAAARLSLAGTLPR